MAKGQDNRISSNMNDIKLVDGTIWKRHIDQLLVDKSTTPNSDPDSLLVT